MPTNPFEHFSSITTPIRVPIDPEHEESQCEKDAYEEHKAFYTEATWRMYYRIVNARNAKE